MAPGGVEGDLLDRAYQELELERGRLLPTSPEPTFGDAGWDSVGEWLMLAHRMGAERVFFVEDDPVILFTRLPPPAGEAEILAAYRRAWSLARPQCLFLSTQDELRVYALTAPPASSVNETDRLEPVEIVTRAADVAEVLARYHREKVESGTFFDERPYTSRDGRADAQLLHDVRAANEALVRGGLPPAVAHALIERVILVRYLEDRSIVTREYFATVAGSERLWTGVLDTEPETPQLGVNSPLVSCLADRDFTYAVFERLEADFNGDLFRVEGDEQECVQQQHLDLLRDLLTGSGLDPQKPLFLWAYDFDVVPTSLISSMYEQFYRAGTDDTAGTHYTPPELVEFVLGRVLTDEVLETSPKICDPACGSGVFLVEAFRRLVRHASSAKGRALHSDELRDLLLSRVVGVDVNPEAIRLAAFSLYLAYLNYQDPRDILRAGSLPHLIHRPDVAAASAVLFAADAFTPTSDEPNGENDVSLPWATGAFDVVVGNPPWSEPAGSKTQLSDDWASKNQLPVGDRSPSQQFLWRSLSFLRSGGVAALLVNATALHNSRSTSRHFRSRWLQEAELREVVNFTSSRTLFFEGAIAPFMLLVFQPRRRERSSSASGMLSYSTVRPSSALAATGALAHAQLERRWVNQDTLANRDYLWKTYAWGNHHDEALMARLDAEERLKNFLPDDPAPGFGYQRGTARPSERLRSLRSLKRFDYWGPLSSCSFEDPPTGAKQQPDERLYDGQRIVIARGVRSGFGPAARLETRPFSFRHTVYCLPLRSVPVWQAETILGTLLSALGRYRLFMASGSWGIWHDNFLASDILGLPARMAGAQASVTKRISRVVSRLSEINYTSRSGSLLSYGDGTGTKDLCEMLLELDEAVFDLFDATEAERDLVRDFMNHTLPLVGRPTYWFRQPTVEIGERCRGTANDLASSPPASQLEKYLSVFLQRWNRELAPRGEFSWFAVASPRVPMIAVVFETQESDARVVEVSETDDSSWRSAVERLEQALTRPVTTSIRAAGTLRSVSDRSIVIAKRNEARLWTASAAREDAEATILQAINLQSVQ